MKALSKLLLLNVVGLLLAFTSSAEMWPNTPAGVVVRSAPPGGGSYSEPFTTANSETLDGLTAPTWIETSQDANCDVDITSNALRFKSESTNCANQYWYAIGLKDLGADQAVAFQLSDQTNWDSSRGPRCVLRSDGDVTTPGSHEEFRCSAPNCPSGRWETVEDTGGFLVNHSVDGDCSLPMGTGDYLGCDIQGTGALTTMRVWALDDAALPSDLEDSSTWGTPDCTLLTNGSTPLATTGGYAGVGVGASGLITASNTYTIDNFSATDQVYSPPNPGPTRSAGSPSGVQASGTTGVTLALTTTGPTDTCKWDTSAGVTYASMANTFSTTGGTSHSTSATGFTDGNSYTRYVRCTDGANPNPTDYAIAFSIDSPLGVSGLVAAAGDTQTFVNWSDSANTLDHDHWHVRHKLDSEPTTWTNDPDASTSNATITSLTNDVLYDVEVQDCDVSETCSSWAATTVTPTVSSASNVSTTDDPNFNSGEPGCDNLTVGPGPANPDYLFCDDFEDGNWTLTNADNPDQSGNDGWHSWPSNDGISPQGTGFNSDYANSSGHMGGPSACPSGCDGQNADHYFYQDQGVDELYVRWYHWWSADYAPGHTKGVTINQPNAGRAGIKFANLHHEYFSSFSLRGFVPNQELVDPSGWIPQNLGVNLTNPTRERWYYVEYRLKLNTPGVKNGILEMWMDDCGPSMDQCTGTPTKRLSRSDIYYRDTGDTTQIGSVWDEHWGNAAAYGEQRKDNFVSSKSFIGFAP